jgi:TolB-like protein/DNA-binding SARP family transcriptional activator/Flp pilus assembly protein TadD
MRLRTLGALDLRSSDGGELRAVLAQPKRVALLAYLALATPRGFHRRDTLTALFWPEHDEEHARNSLSQSVHVLRQTLGAASIVSINGDALSLDWGDFWCDAVAFEEALDGGRLGDAVELYRGELLEGFHVAGAPEFGRWLDAERDRLGRRHMAAMEELARERETAADFLAAATWWRRLAARDPYSSRVTLRLMRALAAAGDPEAAVQHARVHEALVREELDVAPDPEVTALVRQLRASSSAGEAGQRHLFPAPAGGPVMPASTDFESAPAASWNGQSDHRRARRRRVTIYTTLVALSVAAAGIAVFWHGRLSASAPPIRSLAVLPFEDLSADKTAGAFADGMHDELVEEVGRYREFSVISRTSVLQYRGTTKSVSDIARELEVDGIVGGTVLREGGRVRLNVELVHGPSHRHIWGRSYTRDLRDVLELQREVAEAIARELHVATTPVSRARRLASGPRDSLPGELYVRELYIGGRHAELSRSLAGMQTAKEHYRAAIERDSTFALGYASLADVYELMAFYDFAPVRAALDSAHMMAQRAVAIDSTLPEAHTAVAISLADSRDFDAAEREFKRGVDLGPSNAQAHYWYSMLLVALGRGEEALREAERGLELDPFSPRAALGMKRSAQYLIDGSRKFLKLPVKEQRPILKLEPGEPWARARGAAELAEQGRCADARSDILRARQLAPGSNIRMLWYVGTVDWLCGEPAGARAVLAEMKRRPDAPDHGTAIVALHTQFGERDSAFVWLARQQTWTMIHLAFLSADQFMDPLRSDPRFPQLLRRLGIRKESRLIVRTDSAARAAAGTRIRRSRCCSVASSGRR